MDDHRCTSADTGNQTQNLLPAHHPTPSPKSLQMLHRVLISQSCRPSRCGSRTDAPSGGSGRSAGAAAASWPSTACTVPWSATRSRCPSPSSSPPRKASWTPAPPGCLVRHYRLQIKKKIGYNQRNTKASIYILFVL